MHVACGHTNSIQVGRPLDRDTLWSGVPGSQALEESLLSLLRQQDHPKGQFDTGRTRAWKASGASPVLCERNRPAQSPTLKLD